MIIKDFKGKKYNQDKLNKFFADVEAKIEKIEADNQKKFDKYKKDFEKMTVEQKKNARPPHLDGYCTFCGAVRPSGEIGIGGGCERITDNFKDGYVDLFYSELKETWHADLFEAYKKYAKFARALFLLNNKTSKNDFIKSFYKSMEANKEAKISKKQLEVIEKNANYKEYADKLENYKKYVYLKFGYFNKNIFYTNLDYDKEFSLYCQIQYAKAWI